MKMDLIEGSETSTIINQTPGNYPKENLLYSVHGESLKSRNVMEFWVACAYYRSSPWYSVLCPGPQLFII